MSLKTTLTMPATTNPTTTSHRGRELLPLASAGWSAYTTALTVANVGTPEIRRESIVPELGAERVLVVPTEIFHRIGHFQGFCTDIDLYLEELFSADHTSYRPRDLMETDPSFKQLIPYCIFRHLDDQGHSWLFQYTRGKGQGEGRLHSKRSIGVGGHISTVDASDRSANPYLEGLARELEEEVVIDCPYRQRCVGLINDDETEVGRVHLGVVHLFDVESPAVRSREADLVDGGFRRVDELLSELAASDRGRFETWSKICLEALFLANGTAALVGNSAAARDR